jgi:hypothetical protein
VWATTRRLKGGYGQSEGGVAVSGKGGLNQMGTRLGGERNPKVNTATGKGVIDLEADETYHDMSPILVPHSAKS